MQVHPEDRHKTAFQTQHGQYEWTVVPMGLSGAPGIFQLLMNHYLRKFLGDFVLCYLDDILIYSDTLEEHLYQRDCLLLQQRVEGTASAVPAGVRPFNDPEGRVNGG